ncbi:A24 family peptidase [Paenibacillus flagellatus]|uniref:Prepilin peptidase n=1 Tax=Paenibacillus flagellatus TaxID=2211139 RepID=A0A2V5K8M6_9BACL|nr:A24 family peptidase [Paenibacillus flagellatus]PYI55875.1 prepilin peptidase [Paenibacillus flagellatus]
MAYAALILLLLASLYHDVKRCKIPNRYTAGGTVFGIVFHAWSGGWNGLAASATGFAAGFGLLLAVYVVGAVGAGDVKLFGAIGAIAGAPFAINGAINSILFAGAIGLIIVAKRGELAPRLRMTGTLLFHLLLLRDVKGLVRYKKSAAVFPFMYAVAPAVAFTAAYCAPTA